jgi:hypothetical protein
MRAPSAALRTRAFGRHLGGPIIDRQYAPEPGYCRLELRFLGKADRASGGNGRGILFIQANVVYERDMSHPVTRIQRHVSTWHRPLRGVAAGLLIAVSIQACGDDGVGPQGGPRVEVWPEIGMLVSIGDTVQLIGFAFDELGAQLEDAPFSWASSDTTVADVDGNGLVRARGIGHASIVASAAGGVDSALITVDPLMILQNYCGGCHRSAGHSSTGFPLKACPACHLMNRDPDDDRHGFVSVDHKRASDGYALVDAHAPLLCEDCHQLNVQGGTSYWDVADQNDCVGCHLEAYDSIHAGSGFPTACSDCHSQIAWDSVTFEHAAASGGFELLGRHQEIECTSCHDGVTGAPLFLGANQEECFTCHLDDYERQHGGTGIPTACLNCHTNEGWGVVNFDHGIVSGGFDLIGAHAALGCSYCHDVNNNDAQFWHPADENDCITCHQNDYDSQHAGTGTPTACADCHTVDGPWSAVTFDHTQIDELHSLSPIRV